MLFWIFVIMMIVGIVWSFYNQWSEAAWWTLVISAGLVIVSLLILILNYCGLDGDIARNKQRYEMLVYQYENNIYDNDNDLGKRELIVDIQEWNEDLASYKENHDDFWIGIFIPKEYAEFDFISLD